MLREKNYIYTHAATGTKAYCEITGAICTMRLFRLKGNEILVSPATWINLKNIMLNEINQTQKYKCYMIPLIIKYLE